MIIRFLFLLGCFLGSGKLAFSQEILPVPPLRAAVNDLAGIFTSAESFQLDQKLLRFSNERGSQVVVLTVNSVRPETIEEFAIRVAEKWKLGRKGIDDGVLLVVAAKDRELRIEVGYGLEGALNDATTKRIIEEIIIPEFKNGSFSGGIEAGADAILKVISGEGLPKTAKHFYSSSFDVPETIDLVFIVFFGITVFGSVLRAIFGKSIGAMLAGVFGFIVFLFVVSWFWALLLSFVTGLLTLISNGTGGYSSRSRRSYSSGGSSFRGGGGSFGGGGSSGRW